MPIYFPNVPLPDAYRELIARANLPDAEIADLPQRRARDMQPCTSAPDRRRVA
jgi:hypothetical protein